MNQKLKSQMAKLLKLEGAVTESRNVHATVIDSPSPSLNFIFGNGWGLPRAHTMLLYGPPRGGKSIICNAMAGKLHRDNPNAVVVKFNTEFREQAQDQKRVWGIDPERYLAYEVNQPDQIFDRIEKEISAMIQDGMDIPLVIIDSLNDIQGRRRLNAESVMQQTIGDQALTIQDGLLQILGPQRRGNFALILTSHVRSQIDPKGTSATVHTSKTTAIRPAVAWGTQHHAEYYLYVSADSTKDGRTDLSGKLLEDETVTDLNDNHERTGHKVKVRMMDSSLGPKGREGVFTLDYNKGIINVHEEVFLLGINRGVIARPNNLMYAFDGKEWRGKQEMLNAIQGDQQLAQKILMELKRRDQSGMFPDEVAPEASPE